MQAFNIPQMKTINETAKITGLARYHIRQLALQNQIKHVRAGKKILINVDKLIEFLNENNGVTEEKPSNKFTIDKSLLQLDFAYFFTYVQRQIEHNHICPLSHF